MTCRDFRRMADAFLSAQRINSSSRFRSLCRRIVFCSILRRNISEAN